jgi:hypothetical protein
MTPPLQGSRARITKKPKAFPYRREHSPGGEGLGWEMVKGTGRKPNLGLLPPGVRNGGERKIDVR